MKLHVKEFADLVGVSVRTLHYYDDIGLLKPAEVDAQNGYRIYDENSLMRMQEILFFRELDFSLKRILALLSSPNYDKTAALTEQKQLLLLKKERLERVISALDAAVKGEIVMDAFDNREYEQYRDEVKERWGKTKAYAEYTDRAKGRSDAQHGEINAGLNRLMGEFAACMQGGSEPDATEAIELVCRLQDYITEHYYTCTDEILAGLGQLYVADERFRNNIDRHAVGTAAFISAAIKEKLALK